MNEVDLQTISGIQVLAITRDRRSQERLKSLAAFYGWELAISPSYRSAATPEYHSIPIVVCDDGDLDLNWREAFETFLKVDRSKCIILCSNSDDDHLWQNVIRCGGYDVVCKPIREEQMVRAIQFAWRFWKTVHLRPGQGKS
jgi:DNA-binding NarL/FixJ family response regulator